MKTGKPYSKWTKTEVIERVKQISETIGKFPTQQDLAELKEHTITNAISHLKLTYQEIAEELGFVAKQRRRGYWTEDRITQELQRISDEWGEFPSPQQVMEARGDLMRAIYRTHSWRYYKSKLGYEVKEKWDHEKIVQRFKAVVTKLGKTPTTADLKRHDPKLLGAIDHSSQSLRDLILDLGYQPSQRAKGFWKVWENVENTIRPHCKDGKFPPVALLKKELGSSIGLAVADFGGVVEVAERMGLVVSPESYLVAKDGHALKSSYEIEFDDYLSEHEIEHEVDCEVCSDRQIRCDFKIGETYIEIWGFGERTNNKRCERYAKKRIDKERVYRDHNLKLISIEGSVFRKSKTRRREIFQEIVDRCQ